MKISILAASFVTDTFQLLFLLTFVRLKVRDDALGYVILLVYKQKYRNQP